MNDLLVSQADKNADFLNRFERRVKPEETADEKVPNKAIEVLCERQDFLQPFAQRVIALVGKEFFWCWRMIV